VPPIKFTYSLHAKDKLKEEKYTLKSKINKKFIEKVILSTKKKEQKGVKVKIIKTIDEKHAIVVIYKKIKREIYIITFFPVKKGRYEA
jgi:hypothetical protein